MVSIVKVSGGCVALGNDGKPVAVVATASDAAKHLGLPVANRLAPRTFSIDPHMSDLAIDLAKDLNAGRVIDAIKRLRGATSLTLKEAKDIVDMIRY